MLPLSNLKQSWEEVTVDEFLQLKSVEENDFHSLLSFKMDQLFILTEIDIDHPMWEDVDSDQLQEIFDKLKWMNSQPTRNFVNEIELAGKKYTFKGLNTLTFGEFIDLEYYFDINYLLKLPNICAILYRQTRLNEWGHTIIEPRTYNEAERANEFYDVKISQVYGIIQEYLTFKKKFLEAFENMFEEKDLDAEADLPTPQTAEEFEALRQEKVTTKWSWERIIFHFGRTHNLTFDQVTELSLIFVFNQLSMMKDLKLD